IERCQPSSVAMGEHIDRRTRRLIGSNCGNELGAVAADRAIDGDVLVADLGGTTVGGLKARGAWPVADRGHHFVERPFEVDGGRTSRQEPRIGAFERLVGRIGAQRQTDSICGGGADQGLAAHLHGGDCPLGIGEARKPRGDKAMRQLRLIDNADRPAVRFEPDGAGVFAVRLHGPPIAAMRKCFNSVAFCSNENVARRRKMPIDFEAEYNNRARVPEHSEIFARWTREAEDYRAESMKEGRGEVGLKYGSSVRQVIDLFSPQPDVTVPLALFIHGGYWRSLEPSFFSQVARGMNRHGVAVAVAGYDLCPHVTIAEIVDEIRHACLFLWLRTRARMLVFGHSAGGHLAAAMLATDWQAHYPKAPGDLVPAAYS